MDDLEQAVKSLEETHGDIKELLDYQKQEYEDDQELEQLIAQVLGRITQARLSVFQHYAEKEGKDALRKLQEEIEEDDKGSRSED